MKTGRYRVRRGWFGAAILQAEYNTPSFTAGRVDSSLREIYWSDIEYKHAPPILNTPDGVVHGNG